MSNGIIQMAHVNPNMDACMIQDKPTQQCKLTLDRHDKMISTFNMMGCPFNLIEHLHNPCLKALC